MTKGRQALGHSEVEAIRDCAIALKGDRFRGHEYHYSIADVDVDATFAYKMIVGAGINGLDGLTEHNILARTITHTYTQCPRDLKFSFVK